MKNEKLKRKHKQTILHQNSTTASYQNTALYTHALLPITHNQTQSTNRKIYIYAAHLYMYWPLPQENTVVNTTKPAHDINYGL